ncbi:CGNR zinc finger domain-containing protein [Nocardia sp. NPDC052316]|uniref:CGNR zinc finger domain-containing protein n=1 Tax=Nocardia sp. NPDC052316 TaxID=3364329 RepID=UPI0037C7835F
MDDLDLAVELINTLDIRAMPVDRLDSVEHFRVMLRGTGRVRLAGQLHDSDLPRLRWLRQQLRAIFDTAEVADAAHRMNTLLREIEVVPQLHASPHRGLAIGWGTNESGFSELAARLVGALAEHLIAHGTTRLGVCAAAPCRCVFVDRTRPGTRKYCKDACNDRVAAAAYYYRRRAARSHEALVPHELRPQQR